MKQAIILAIALGFLAGCAVGPTSDSLLERARKKCENDAEPQRIWCTVGMTKAICLEENPDVHICGELEYW